MSPDEIEYQARLAALQMAMTDAEREGARPSLARAQEYADFLLGKTTASGGLRKTRPRGSRT